MIRRGGSVGPPDQYQSRGSPGYYYSRSSAAAQPIPSPSHSQHSQQRAPMSQPIVRRSADYRSEPLTPRSDHHHSHHRNVAPYSSLNDPRIDEMTPSYFVEHLATFAVGRQFGVAFAADGIRKLKQMEKNSAIWAQPLILRFRQNAVTVEDENGELVEQFALDLIEQPTAHVSNDPRDTYNNILLFIVREDRKRTATPTEMHIFQCNRVSATDVADDLQAYIRGQFRRVQNGRRKSAAIPFQQLIPEMPMYPADDASISSETSEMFERDVNTLNRCFDDIERFVARCQSAAYAQRELEQQNIRYRTANRKKHTGPDPNGILLMRAQVPIEAEFVEIFRKFKLSFNLLARLKNHIHEPNAPELLHFLFTPLSVVLESCHWGLGRNIAPSVTSPLISVEARELMQNCLTSRENDIWMSLGEAWRTPLEDWRGPLPPPYRPVFLDGFAPYGVADRVVNTPNPLHRGQSAPPEHYRQSSRDRNVVDTAPNTPISTARTPRSRPQRNMSVDNLELDRLTLERERLEFEKAKIIERENRLRAEEKQIEDEKRRLNAEKDLIKKETLKEEHSSNSKRYDPPLSSSPRMASRGGGGYSHVKVAIDQDTSPRQQAFIDDVINRGGKLVIATFDRSGQNAKELTVHRGEYLEVLYDEKNWWECKNMHQRVGYVPHTILSMVPLEHQPQPPYNTATNSYATTNNNGQSATASSNHPPGMLPEDAPSYVKERQGKRGGNYLNHHQPLISDAGVQVDIRHERVPSTLVAAPPPPPPPPAIAPFEDLLREQKSKMTSVATSSPPPPPPPSSTMAKMHPALDISRRRGNTELVGELNATIGRSETRALRPAELNRTSRVAIHDKSSPDDVRRWLQEKGFSPRVIDLLDGQDGANLFSLSKLNLQQACGRDEGAYLYSQLLVQKKRSGYRTHTGDELRAILNQRRTRVELSNETPADEPTFVIDSH
ncbi:unnamed protein product [Caenorhabditis bovis]|uniref:SH3 domain-containing protein n=1 Tax=Caenorhabditis bovis TaxID=2654633 RepID=A0A8S1EZD9_9PELO|nr:unnamed protein product [Caenorhabditis bovis]